MNTDLIGQSWDKIAANQEELVRRFYQLLFERYPHYKPLFPDSMTRQMEKIVKTLALVARVSEPEVVHSQMIRLGHKHRPFNLKREDLLNFKQTFLEVLGDYCSKTCPNLWSTDCVTAWNQAFDERIIPFMIQGLEENLTDVQKRRIINLQTGAGNQFLGTVVSIRQEALSAEVVLQLQGGDQIVSRITPSGVRNLKLVVGSPVYALIKPAQIMLLHAETGLQLSARNCFCGRVLSTEKGILNAKVTLKLRSGNIIQAQVTQDTLGDLGIKEGERVCCVFRAFDVILAVEKGVDAVTSGTAAEIHH